MDPDPWPYNQIILVWLCVLVLIVMLVISTLIGG